MIKYVGSLKTTKTECLILVLHILPIRNKQYSTIFTIKVQLLSYATQTEGRRYGFSSENLRNTNLGTLPWRRKSRSVACRRALANALKVASIMWWEFFPASCDFSKIKHKRDCTKFWGAQQIKYPFAHYEEKGKISAPELCLLSTIKIKHYQHLLTKEQANSFSYLSNVKRHSRCIYQWLEKVLNQLKKWKFLSLLALHEQSSILKLRKNKGKREQWPL